MFWWMYTWRVKTKRCWTSQWWSSAIFSSGSLFPGPSNRGRFYVCWLFASLRSVDRALPFKSQGRKEGGHCEANELVNKLNLNCHDFNKTSPVPCGLFQGDLKTSLHLFLNFSGHVFHTPEPNFMLLQQPSRNLGFILFFLWF